MTLELHELEKSYGGRKILGPVTLSLGPGEGLAIVGDSGSGKSTLLQIAAGLLAPDRGEVRLRGIAREQSRIHEDVQLVLQDARASLDPKWTIKRSLLEPHMIRGGPAPDLTSVLQTLGLDPSILMRRPSELSGGQRQRVVWARAWLCAPRFLLLDESFKGLDGPRVRSLGARLAAAKAEGMGVCAVTHDLRQVLSWADRVVVLDQGHVTEDQALAEFRREATSSAGKRLRAAALRLSGAQSSC